MKKTAKLIFYLVFIAILIVGGFMLFKSWTDLRKMRYRVSDLEDELRNKNNECLELHENIYDLKNNPNAIEKVAREKFKFCKEDEVIFTYDTKQEKKSSGKK